METANASKNGASSDGTRYRFEEFEVDPANRTCARDGEPVPISGKVYDILLAFVENPGRLLSKDELIERIWPNEFVEEGNLARNVSTLRKFLGDTQREHKFILTVPGHGYRFAVDVSTVRPAPTAGPGREPVPSETDDVRPTDVEGHQLRSRKLLWAGVALILLFTAAWFGKDRLFTSSPTVKTIAVLPLKGIDPNDNYLGFGIADAVIRRLSNSGQVTVRPASAVLHYVNRETDSLAAAREMNADAVVEGNIQRSGDRLRISLNMLRVSDGISIWSENFDKPANDIFRVQDEVSEQVAEKLKVRLGSPILTSFNKYPVDQRAYEFYLKGMFELDTRGFNRNSLPQMLNTIATFQQAIVLDPNYAMAHGQLAFCYAWMAFFVQPEEPKWIDLARQEIAIAEKLDPNVAEAHIANGLIYWSGYGGHKNEDAIKEFRLAKQLNPGYNGADLIALYGHTGLDEQAVKELNRGLMSDPTSKALNDLSAILPFIRGDFDAWYALDPSPLRASAPWYLLHKGDLDRAEKELDVRIEQHPEENGYLMLKALLLAMKGRNAEADSQIQIALAKSDRNKESYHHEVYFLACTKASEGDSSEAVKWLRETANSGLPDYTLFARDPFLDRIRQSPEFIQFLAEQKAQWEHFEQEFPVE